MHKPPKNPSASSDRSTLQGVFLGLAVVVLLAVILLYRQMLQLNTWRDLSHQFFPCRLPITYNVDQFDHRFDISKSQFQEAIVAAENLWEAETGKNLFEQREKNELAINLIYDYRQAGTEKLQELNLNIQTNNESYERLKFEYDSAYQTYLDQKAALDTFLNQHDARSAAYEAEVARVDKQGGASPKKYKELEAERRTLNAEAAAINAQVKDINESADTVNTLADALNDLADKLNLTAERYNTIGDALGDEFVEGTFGASSNGNEINIYQFEDQEKLIRVLAHELGHALGLDHVDDPEAIMYRLNEGESGELSDADISALHQLCRIK